MIHIEYEGPLPAFQGRRMLTQDLQEYLSGTVKQIKKRSWEDWNLMIGPDLLFDARGLSLIVDALKKYRGHADQLEFKLETTASIGAQYYHHNFHYQDEIVDLPVSATRSKSIGNGLSESITLTLPKMDYFFDAPASLAKKEDVHIPLALLLPHSCEHDFYFANRIALFSHLATAAKKSFGAWWQAMNMAGIKSYKKAVSLAYKDVHKKAYVHPTAVVEGSVIGEGAHIGAHCVVRYSVIGKNVNLHDGAKVEYSVVDDQSWLMHDLVLYHSVTETEVFLIHGPYQFSYFQHTSAAFATIMMDYKPDERPIRIATPNGVVDVGSRFMGALLEEKSKVLGGTMTAPGITIFEGQHIGPDASQIVKAKDLKRESKSSESLSDLEQTA